MVGGSAARNSGLTSLTPSCAACSCCSCARCWMRCSRSCSAITSCRMFSGSAARNDGSTPSGRPAGGHARATATRHVQHYRNVQVRELTGKGRILTSKRAVGGSCCCGRAWLRTTGAWLWITRAWLLTASSCLCRDAAAVAGAGSTASSGHVHGRVLTRRRFGGDRRRVDGDVVGACDVRG